MLNKTIKGFIWVELFLIILSIFLMCPIDLNEELKKCYYQLCVQLIIFYILWSIILSKVNIDIFEPIILVTLIHLLLFEITPIICLWTNRIDFFGIYIWQECIKATYISTIGYVFLLFSYFCKNNRNREKKRTYFYDINNKKKYLYLNYCIWIIAFICNVIVIQGYGLSLKYLLTGGQAIMKNAVISKSSYGFLVIIAYAMIPSFLYIFELSTSRVIKIAIFYLMFMSFYVRGFRFIMIAVLIAPLVYSYLKKNKRPSINLILFILIGLSIFSSYMQFARAFIRSGVGGDIDINKIFNIENILEVLIENFEIFKTYYAIVEHFPKNIPYTLGIEIFLYTLVLLVPRFIWSGKPQPEIYKVISNAVNSASRDAGTSFPYIGEYYFEFGAIGVCIFMIILGKLFSKLKGYMYKKDIHSCILYSCIYPLILQLLIRGYTPTNFYMILAVVAPIFITKKICN